MYQNNQILGATAGQYDSPLAGKYLGDTPIRDRQTLMGTISAVAELANKLRAVNCQIADKISGPVPANKTAEIKSPDTLVGCMDALRNCLREALDHARRTAAEL